jgi:hypothetical protein
MFEDCITYTGTVFQSHFGYVAVPDGTIALLSIVVENKLIGKTCINKRGLKKNSMV